MKVLAIVALVLGAAAVGSNVYAVVETLPNYESFTQMALQQGDPLMNLLVEDYRNTLRLEAYSAFGLGVLATILGGVAGLKGKKPLAWGGALLGIAGLIWQFVWAV